MVESVNRWPRSSIEGDYIECLAGKLTSFDEVCGYISALEVSNDLLKVDFEEQRRRTLELEGFVKSDGERSMRLQEDLSKTQREIRALTAERDAYKQNFQAELAGAGDLREQYGARENETFFDFVQRLHDETIAARQQLEEVKAERDALKGQDTQGVIFDLRQTETAMRSENAALSAAAARRQEEVLWMATDLAVRTQERDAATAGHSLAAKTLSAQRAEVERLTEALQEIKRRAALDGLAKRILDGIYEIADAVLTPPAARQGEDTWTQEQIDAAKAKAKRQVALFADQPARPADPVADAGKGSGKTEQEKKRMTKDEAIVLAAIVDDLLGTLPEPGLDLGAVNYGDLRVVDIVEITSLLDNEPSRIEIQIEEADPSSAIGMWIADKLWKSGDHRNIQVVTEW